MRKRGNVTNLQDVSQNWSDLLYVKALKTKLPVNRSTFLKHGKTYTIVKKEASDLAGAFDINLRPPLILKNCLPVPIQISFTDSNGEKGKYTLYKEEEKHVFAFNLQDNVELNLKVPNFEEYNMELDCADCNNKEFRHTLYD